MSGSRRSGGSASSRGRSLRTVGRRMRVPFITDLPRPLIVYGPGPAVSCPSPASWPVCGPMVGSSQFPDHQPHGWYARSAVISPSRADRLDPAGRELLHRWPPSGRPQRRVPAVCHSSPDRGAAAMVATLIACGGTGWQASASWLMVPAAGAGTMGVWRSVSSWTGPNLQPAVFGSSGLLSRILGSARGRKSASPAGWGCCGRCMR